MTVSDSIHRFSVKGIEGTIIDFAQFKGKKIMVVNVASECGYTPQYAQLQELYETFQDKLVVIGFPCNDFGNQEPGSENEIQAFCSVRFGVTFPLTSKVSILKNPSPVYQWLMQKSQNGVADSEVTWNFQKYLLDENGHLINVIAPSASPFDEQVLEWLSDDKSA
jgi:glutathione peroxidase